MNPTRSNSVNTDTRYIYIYIYKHLNRALNSYSRTDKLNKKQKGWSSKIVKLAIAKMNKFKTAGGSQDEKLELDQRFDVLSVHVTTSNALLEKSERHDHDQQARTKRYSGLAYARENARPRDTEGRPIIQCTPSLDKLNDRGLKKPTPPSPASSYSSDDEGAFLYSTVSSLRQGETL